MKYIILALIALLLLVLSLPNTVTIAEAYTFVDREYVDTVEETKTAYIFTYRNGQLRPSKRLNADKYGDFQTDKVKGSVVDGIPFRIRTVVIIYKQRP